MQKSLVLLKKKNRFFMYSIIFFLLAYSLSFPNSDEISHSVLLEKNHIEFGYGHYDIGDIRYKKIYSQGGKVFSLELSRLVLTNKHHHVGISVGVRYFTKKGRATFTGESSSLTINPLTLGLRYFLSLNSFIPWFEIGMDHYSYKEKSEIHITNGSVFGYHLQGGLYIRIPCTKNLKVKISVKHTKALTEENNIKINLGGLEYSLGLAFGLNLF
jgi:hypothetical protein